MSIYRTELGDGVLRAEIRVLSQAPMTSIGAIVLNIVGMYVE